MCKVRAAFAIIGDCAAPWRRKFSQRSNTAFCGGGNSVSGATRLSAVAEIRSAEQHGFLRWR
ncbi:MAG: hypothetical protein K2H73_02780, partial [Treponemataceae bacterium]|nr:hypothetical protein [Treponemataceae bacterium]